jgi:hypothetical protein
VGLGAPVFASASPRGSLTVSALETLISKIVRGGGRALPSSHLRVLEGP